MPIVCGSDLSAASSGALEVARALAAQRGDAEVVLVHVVDPELDSPGSHDKAFQQTRVELDAQATQTAGAPTVRTELVVGSPDEVLADIAEREGADLIIVAARSTSVSQLRLGSTAAKLITRAAVPVLALRDPAPWLAFARNEKPLRLMLGIDDSATCDLSIQWTKALRARGPVEIVLGAVYYPDEAAEHYGLPAGSFVDKNPVVESYIERDLLRRYGEMNGVTAKAQLGLGRIGDHVIELANDTKIDAIVVGTNQKTGIGRLGSVSSVIVDDAPQSVVCVPPNARITTQSVPILRTALVATDLSQFSNRAVPFAFGVIEPDGEVHIVHIVKDDDDIDVQAVLRALQSLAPTGAKQKVNVDVLRGDDAAQTVAQAAARLGVDVICIASHGRSGITRALVGSVADRLLRATRLPVVVLRPA